MKATGAHIQLKEFVTKQHFKQIERVFKQNFKLPLEFCDINGKQIRSLSSHNCYPGFCQRVRQSKFGFQRCRQGRLRCLNISIETGLPHVTLCHAGIFFGCIPVMNGDLPLGGLLFGRCIYEPFDKMLEADIQQRLRGLHIYEYEILDALQKLSVISARRIHEAAEFLYILLYETVDLNPQVVQWRRRQSHQQTQMNPHFHENKLFDTGRGYPYKLEHQFIAKTKLRDKTRTKEMLYPLLEQILLENPDNINLLKAHLVELLSTLSRAAAQTDTDINILLSKNIDYIHNMLNMNTQEDICVWFNEVLDDFIECIYSSQDTKNMSKLKPAIEYMENHYNLPITLVDLSKVARLSVSRLSHLFREQMGITPIDYLTQIRIDHAKRMLLTSEYNCTRISYEAGYNNQSYFTRVFKKVTGLTPQQFREQKKGGNYFSKRMANATRKRAPVGLALRISTKP